MSSSAFRLTTGNSNNPLFSYLQTMFPALDNAVLYSVLQSSNNSVDKAIDVLLEFNNTEIRNIEPDLPEEDDSSPFWDLPVPTTRKPLYFGVDDVKLQARKRAKQRRGRRARKASKPKKWIPLEEFVRTQQEQQLDNVEEPIAANDEVVLPPVATAPAEEEVVENWEARLDSEVDFFAFQQPPAVTVADENPFSILAKQSDSTASLRYDLDEPSFDDFAWEADWNEESVVSSDVSDSPVEVSAPDTAEREEPSTSDEPQTFELDCSLPLLEEEEEFREEEQNEQREEEQKEDLENNDEPQTFQLDSSLPLLEEEVEEKTTTAVPPPSPAERVEEALFRDYVVIVKIYLDDGDIHRFSSLRSTFTFKRLQDRVAYNLLSRSKPSADQKAYAIQYADDEGDKVSVCAEDEMMEALRLHEEVIWPSSTLPEAGRLLRLYVSAVDPCSVNPGHIVV